MTPPGEAGTAALRRLGRDALTRTLSVTEEAAALLTSRRWFTEAAMKRTSMFLIAIIFLATAMLAVPAAAQVCVEPPAGLVSWWPGTGMRPTSCLASTERLSTARGSQWGSLEMPSALTASAGVGTIAWIYLLKSLTPV